jgi:hypothetical protein
VECAIPKAFVCIQGVQIQVQKLPNLIRGSKRTEMFLQENYISEFLVTETFEVDYLLYKSHRKNQQYAIA